MKIKLIKFKVTTGKLKCNKCKKRLKGVDGFIHIVCEVDSGIFNSGMSNIRICWDCFINILKEVNKDRKNRKIRYRELVKRAILRNL